MEQLKEIESKLEIINLSDCRFPAEFARIEDEISLPEKRRYHLNSSYCFKRFKKLRKEFKEIGIKAIAKAYVPKDAGIKKIFLDYNKNTIIIEAEEPGLANGHGGENTRKISRKSGWKVQVEGVSNLYKGIIEIEKLNSRSTIRKKDSLPPMPSMDSLIPTFFLRKTILSGYRTLKEIAISNNLSSGRDIDNLAGRVEDSYMEFEKNSRHTPLRVYCLEKVLEIMEKHPDEDNVQFIGRRAEAYLDLGQIEKKDETKREACLEQSYRYLLKQIEYEESGRIEPRYKLAKVCDLFSKLHVNDERKGEKIEKGIKIIEELWKRQIEEKGESNTITDNILGFLYIKRADFKNNPNKENDREKGISLVKDCLKKLNPSKINYVTTNIYSYAGNALSISYKIKTTSKNGERRLDSLEESDLENLVGGVICSELSEKFGNKESENYQVIGREYYDLQYLIEKADRGEVEGISVKRIKEKIIGILSQKNNRMEDIFSKYSGGLREIISLEDTLPQIGKEMQFIAVEHAFDAFVKSNSPLEREEGDNSPDNKSYRGMCLVDMVRLNNLLNKFSKEDARKMLSDAEFLLGEACKERGEFEDYRRLSECYFRLADVVDDINKKKKLYRSSAALNLRVKRKLDSQHKDVKSEIISFIASSYYKLAQFAKGKKKEDNFNEAIRYFNIAYKTGDKSAENRGKTGSCYLRLLEIKLKEEPNSVEIPDLIRKSKETLEEAAEIGEKREGGFVYPYCLLAELSDFISDNKIKDYDEMTKEHSWENVVERLFKNKKNLETFLSPLNEGKKEVQVVDDEYGLMKRDLIIKESKDEEELKQEFLRNKFIYEELKEALNLASDSVPFSRPINFIQKDDKYYYVMRRSKGINLDQKFKFFAGKYALAKENEN